MIIYKTTNLVNNKFYIGQDSNNNINYLGSGTLLIKAINKYGKENFRKEVIELCSSKKELDEREIFWIKTLNATNRNIAYNIREGGGGGPLTDNTKALISQALTGRIFSKEHKENISKNHYDASGPANPMFGKKHSKEIVEASRKRATGKKANKETKLKMSKANQGKLNSNAKLSEKDVLEIRRIYSENRLGYNEIGQIYGVKKACIYKIIKRLTWIHL